jgi:hypothetical protein
VFVFSRGGTSGPAYCAAAQLLEFDADGKFVGEIEKCSACLAKQASSSSSSDGFTRSHARPENELDVAELLKWRIQKLILRRPSQ